MTLVLLVFPDTEEVGTWQWCRAASGNLAGHLVFSNRNECIHESGACLMSMAYDLGGLRDIDVGSWSLPINLIGFRASPCGAAGVPVAPCFVRAFRVDRSARNLVCGDRLAISGGDVALL